MKPWKKIIIAAVLFLLGIMVASVFRCRQPVIPVDDTDVLVKENIITNERYERICDSLEYEIKVKEEKVVEADHKIIMITAKYRALLNREPSHDTVVQTHEVFIGKECLEKMPVLEAKIQTYQGEVSVLTNLIKTKTDHIIALQGQFDRSIMLGEQQAKENKKLTRQKRANKAWAVIATAGAGAAVIATFVVH